VGLSRPDARRTIDRDIDDAAKEVHRVAKMGLKGLELSCSWDMEPMWHPSWEPFWQAVDEVHCRCIFTPSRRPRRAPGRRRRRSAAPRCSRELAIGKASKAREKFR
jgi:hypothetical protein